MTTIFDLGHTTARSGFAGFSARALAPHTDRSGIVYPPALLAICCSQPAESGGECVLVDGQTVYDDLAANQPDTLKSLFLPRSVQFGGAGGYLGSILSKGIADRIILRARFDDLAKFSPALNRWILKLSDTIDRHAITFTLRAGEGYILDNHRWLHGRRAFTGQRVIHRITADPLPDVDIRTGIRAYRPS